MDFKKIWKKTWYFIWEDNSLPSWIINVALAFLLIKFIIYPGLGLMLGTAYPVVAVMSGSMEHDGSFNNWWNSEADCNKPCTQAEYYSQYNITKEDFKKFPFKNGFNKGDIMVLVKPDNLKLGDVVVFWSGKKDPIIHRIILEKNSHIQTKGDHNTKSIYTTYLNEYNISYDDLIGKAIIRIPLLGYVKIIFTEFLNLVRLP